MYSIKVTIRSVTYATVIRLCLIDAFVTKAYHLHFDCKIGDQNKEWAPHTWCATCAVSLRAWLRGRLLGGLCHLLCRFLGVNTKMMRWTSCVVWLAYLVSPPKTWSQANTRIHLQQMRPVPHDDNLQIFQSSQITGPWKKQMKTLQCWEWIGSDNVPDFEPSLSGTPHLITQSESNDRIRDLWLSLSETEAKLLGSRLQE